MNEDKKYAKTIREITAMIRNDSGDYLAALDDLAGELDPGEDRFWVMPDLESPEAHNMTPEEFRVKLAMTGIVDEQVGGICIWVDSNNYSHVSEILDKLNA
jgi:hypothetical protein